MKIIYSSDALDDLKRLYDFIAKHNIKSGKKLRNRLLSSIKNLSEFPKSGRLVDKDLSGIHELIIDKYVIRYKLYKKHIVIARIWHSKEITK